MWQLYRKTPENLRFSDKLLEAVSDQINDNRFGCQKQFIKIRLIICQDLSFSLYSINAARRLVK